MCRLFWLFVALLNILIFSTIASGAIQKKDCKLRLEDTPGFQKVEYQLDSQCENEKVLFGFVRVIDENAEVNLQTQKKEYELEFCSPKQNGKMLISVETKTSGTGPARVSKRVIKVLENNNKRLLYTASDGSSITFKGFGVDKNTCFVELRNFDATKNTFLYSDSGDPKRLDIKFESIQEVKEIRNDGK